MLNLQLPQKTQLAPALPEVAFHKDASATGLRRAVRLLPAVELQTEDVEVAKQLRNVVQIKVEASRAVGLDVPVVADFLALPEAQLRRVLAAVISKQKPATRLERRPELLHNAW